LCYTGGTRNLYGYFRYDDGMQINAFTSGVNYVEKPTIGLIATDPFWYEDNQEMLALSELDFIDTLSSNNRAAARIDGAWQNLGTGFNGEVLRIIHDANSGRIYFGGAFTTANGVTVNGICYWNGTTFVAMGGATKGIAGGGAIVYGIAVAANGDVWVCGDFTSAGGSSASCLAKWVPSTNAWTCYTDGGGTASTTVITSVVIDRDGIVYIGGTFLNWQTDGDQDRVAQFDGTTWTELVAGGITNGQVNVMELGLDGKTIYIGGTFTTPQTRICYYSGGALHAMASGSAGTVYAILASRSGHVYIGGDISPEYVARWDGNTWLTVGGGVNNVVYMIEERYDGLIIMAGSFTTTSTGSTDSRTVKHYAYWNGSSWAHVDVSLPDTPAAKGACFVGDDLYIGYNEAGTGFSSKQTTLTSFSTTMVFPVITISGLSAAGPTKLEWIENQSTAQVMYFNQSITIGETVTIDLSPFKKTVTSSWRGVIHNQPLPNSDFSNWHLLPGANVIAAFISGTTTDVYLTFRWTTAHWSIDGTS